MSAIKGDFISFTYNGVHSTELGIVRVTSSNRYTDLLIPSLQDKTVLVPGGNGTYFFGSYYTARNITINIAYDSVTENLIRLMRETFSGDAPHELVFDDEPYKVYYAKVTGMPQLLYIPFDSEDAIRSRVYDDSTISYSLSIYERVYKGEGTLTFTCYDPFAHTPYNCKYLNLYTCEKKTSADFIQGSAHEGTSIGNKKTRIALGKIENGEKVNSYISVTSDTYYKIRTNLPNGFVYELNSSKTWLNTRALSNGTKYFKTLEDTKFITVALYINNTLKMDPSMLTNFSISKPSWYDPSYADNPTKWKGEWIDSARLLNSNSGYDNNTNDNDENNIFNLYNPGDVETDFQLIIPFDADNYMNKITGITVNGVTLGIDFTKFVGTIPSLQGYSYHLCFDSKTNLVKVLRRSNTSGKYVETGTIHNEILKLGVWPKIPVTGSIYIEIFEEVNNMNDTKYNNNPTKYWYIDGDVYVNCTINDLYVEGRTYYTKEDGYEPATKKEFKINLISDASLPARPTLNYDYLYY